MGIKVDWKKIGRVVLPIGEQLFPVIGVIEKLTKFKQLNSQEKQNLAFEALSDQLVGQIAPQVLQDTRVQAAIRKLIDDGVALNNAIAQVNAEKSGPAASVS